MTHPQQPNPDSTSSHPQQPPHPPGVPLGLPTTAPTKRTKRLVWILGGVGVVFALCCGVGAVATLVGGQEGTGNKKVTEVSAPPKASATSTSPTASAAMPPATTAAATTAAAPPAVPKPKVYSGRGDDVVKVGSLTDLAVIKFSCPRCTSNTVVTSDGPEGLLVNAIGAYTGKKWINLDESALTTQMEIQASGKWTLTVGSVDQVASKAGSGKASGRGDDVVVLGGGADAAKITHSKGTSNFVVEAYGLETGEGGLLINEIGGYSGVRPLDAPALVQVTADGNWTISPA